MKWIRSRVYVYVYAYACYHIVIENKTDNNAQCPSGERSDHLES